MNSKLSAAFGEKQIMVILVMISRIYPEAQMHIHIKSLFISHAGKRKNGKHKDLQAFY